MAARRACAFLSSEFLGYALKRNGIVTHILGTMILGLVVSGFAFLRVDIAPFDRCLPGLSEDICRVHLRRINLLCSITPDSYDSTTHRTHMETRIQYLIRFK
jgi:hypothetical protein